MWWKVLHALAYVIRLSFRITIWLGLIPFRVIGYLTDCALWLGGQFRGGERSVRKHWNRILHAPSWVRDYAVISIAVTALVFSILQGVQQRTHDRLSVRPILQIGRYLTPDPSRGHVGLYLTNDGVGVALMQQAHLEIHAKGITTELHAAIKQRWDDSGAMAALNTLWTGKHPDFPNAKIREEVASALRAGESIYLFGIPTELHTPEIEKALYKLLNGISLTITYESIYGETFETSL